jgi:hypothetical protein
MRDRIQAMLQDENTARSLALLPATVTPMARHREEESVPVGQPATKKARVGNDLPERANIKDSDARTKLIIMKGIWDQRQDWGKLTSGADSFKKKFLKPAMFCLENHFGGSIDAFVAKYHTQPSSTPRLASIAMEKETPGKPRRMSCLEFLVFLRSFSTTFMRFYRFLRFRQEGPTNYLARLDKK